MLVSLARRCIPERSNNVSQCAQAFIDALGLLEPFLIIARSTRIEALRTSEVDQVERAFARLLCQWVRAADAKREDRM